MLIQIRSHKPLCILTNLELERIYPDWTAEKIFEKTGIRERHVVLEGECASDLAFAAAERLFVGRGFAANQGMRPSLRIWSGGCMSCPRLTARQWAGPGGDSTRSSSICGTGWMPSKRYSGAWAGCRPGAHPRSRLTGPVSSAGGLAELLEDCGRTANVG